MMSTRWIIAPLLGAFLCACGSEAPSDSGDYAELLVVTGYTEAVVDNKLTISEFFEASYDDKRFQEIGTLLRAFHNGQSTEPGVEVSTNHETFVVFVKITLGDTPQHCAEIGEGGAAACVEYRFTSSGTYCHIYTDERHRDSLWGHELWHCLAGDFHE